MSKRIIAFDRQGNVRFIHTPDVASMMACAAEIETTARASYVEPAGPFRRTAFRLLRRLLGDRPCDTRFLIRWTRTWRGRWSADMAPSNGPHLGTFATRQEAIDAEVAWLLKHKFHALHVEEES